MYYQAPPPPPAEVQIIAQREYQGRRDILSLGADYSVRCGLDEAPKAPLSYIEFASSIWRIVRKYSVVDAAIITRPENPQYLANSFMEHIGKDQNFALIVLFCPSVGESRYPLDVMRGLDFFVGNDGLLYGYQYQRIGGYYYVLNYVYGGESEF